MIKNIKERVSLKEYCTYKTGGEARFFASPKNSDDLIETITWANSKGLTYEIVGYGANILFSDTGYDGLIINLRDFNKKIDYTDGILKCGAGVLLDNVVRYACKNSLGGIESLSGIPGTVGGAVKMNAGAFGTEMKDIITKIEALSMNKNNNNLSLEEVVLNNSEILFEYRNAVGIIDKIVINAYISLIPSSEGLMDIRNSILERRALKQPLSFPSCGSVFKRPKNTYAGLLIEELSLKGKRIGGACISEKHANFIINYSNATSEDIYSLIQYTKEKVLKDKGVLLEEEVRYIGNFKT